MSDYGDDYDDDYDGDGWLYLEEPDDLAENLAERAVPSPAPQDVADPDALYDSDFFEYFCDIEYNSDGFNDVEADRAKDTQDGRSSNKAKGKATLKSASQKPRTSKNDKHGVHSVPPAVAWRSQESRTNYRPMEMFKDGDEKPYALFKDHEQRFRDAPGFSFRDAPEETDEAANDMITIDKKEAERRLAVIMQDLSSNAVPMDEVDPVKLITTVTEWVDNCGIDEEDLLRMLERAVVEEGLHSSEYYASKGREIFQKAIASEEKAREEGSGNVDGLDHGFIEEIEDAIARTDAIFGEDGDEDEYGDGDDQDGQNGFEEGIIPTFELMERINQRDTTPHPAAYGMEGISKVPLSPGRDTSRSASPPCMDKKGKSAQKQPQTTSAGPSASNMPPTSNGKRKAVSDSAAEVLGKLKRLRSEAAQDSNT